MGSGLEYHLSAKSGFHRGKERQKEPEIYTFRSGQQLGSV
jgi:hypothetical protein